jgi:hypothetical protein
MIEPDNMDRGMACILGLAEYEVPATGSALPLEYPARPG